MKFARRPTERFYLYRQNRKTCAEIICIAGAFLFSLSANAADPPQSIQWDFGTEETSPGTTLIDVVRDQSQF